MEEAEDEVTRIERNPLRFSFAHMTCDSRDTSDVMPLNEYLYKQSQVLLPQLHRLSCLELIFIVYNDVLHLIHQLLLLLFILSLQLSNTQSKLVCTFS